MAAETWLDPDEQLRAVALLRDLIRLKGRACKECDAAMCGHELLMSVVLGFKEAPRCAGCLAAGLEQSRGALRDQLYAHVVRRRCNQMGWLWANREEGIAPDALPTCLWPDAEGAGRAPTAIMPVAAQVSSAAAGPPPATHAEWNAGDMSCGDLVLELRIRLAAMRSAEVLRVIALDRGAPEDLPAWCRLTGHTLLAMSHPDYWIRRKDD